MIITDRFFIVAASTLSNATVNISIGLLPVDPYGFMIVTNRFLIIDPDLNFGSGSSAIGIGIVRSRCVSALI